jgi:hypothetical protein
MNILGGLDKVNISFISESTVFSRMIAADYMYAAARNDLVIDTLGSYTETDYVIDLFSNDMTNGLEGFISDMWFKFVQFVKRIIANTGVMFKHFVNGLTSKNAYLETRYNDLFGMHPDVSGMLTFVASAYTPTNFKTMIDLIGLVEKVLGQVLAKPDLDLDSVTDFAKHGITFRNGRVYKNSTLSRASFSFNIDQVNQRSMVAIGWNSSNFLPHLKLLLDKLDFNDDKDYMFVDFKSNMERLVRKTERSANADSDVIRRLTNTITTVSEMMVFTTDTYKQLTGQMVAMVKAAKDKGGAIIASNK